ncbi:FtsX-like permease family protein [Streptomyces tsukubensis]|uniref:ABC transporter permease n=3 Tax=Streptomyces TaxID=1883 RepID=A0A7G3UGB9_STRT9|nr:FtsX-like permease family protein [Streptomyces tsukubensis]AZK94534.1 ABC transporter permease [Streptomyces tsukubensis]QKM69376.1 ABC transporter permease [Streptomyces tsukubensis NRRL18488]TAI42690.1 ABC transporter permease [Streptomyces tsukubensis]
MLSIALRSLRLRWTGFLGTFTALALGTGIITTMGLALAAAADAPVQGPQRFAKAPTVVRPVDELSVRTPVGIRTAPLAHPRPLTPRQLVQLAALGRTVVDRSFPVRIGTGPEVLTGHPWSTAAFAPYTLTSGRAPKAPGEVVVTGTRARPGEVLRTAAGPVTVVGTVRDLGFEDAVFYTDRRAAALSPRVDHVVVDAPPEAVRAAVAVIAPRTADPGSPPALRVLTGADRRLADPDPDREEQAVVALYALLGTAAGITGFVSVLVTASAFAFAVVQRRKEFALLRTAGATPGQIRRMLFAEALAVGAVAAAAGCLLGSQGTPQLARHMVANEVAPVWFTGAVTATGSVWPYHLAFWTGLVVAFAGVVAASWRAGRTDPLEALRDASADARTPPRGRYAGGVLVLAAAAGTLAYALVSDPGELLHRKTYTSRPLLLITAFALLVPAFVRPLARLLTWLPARRPGAGGLLVRAHASARVRRTAAVAAPVLVTVALAGSLLGTVATLDGARAAEIRSRTAADHILTTTASGGFAADTVDRLRAVPGVRVFPSAASAVFVREEGAALIRSDARATDPAALAATVRLPLVAGDAGRLDDRSIIVDDAWEQHTVGDTVDLWRGDGSRATLRIAAVMRAGTGDNGVYLTPRNAPGSAVDRIDVAITPGADRAAVGEALRRTAAAIPGTEVRSRTEWVAAARPEPDRRTLAGYAVVLGIALLYTAISLANTLLMAAPEQTRELALLRLTGATGPQLLRLAAAEAVTAVAVGAILGAVVTALNLAGIHGALAVLGVPHSPPDIPWEALGATTAACGLIAAGCAAATAAVSLRGPVVRP